MVVIPAIDIKEGKCVRLVKGEADSETVFSDDPVSVARRWEDCGAEVIHVVDLDGAFTGAPVNHKLIEEITGAVSCGVQAGGGIRTLETVRMYLSCGIQTVILGTAALEKTDFLKSACSEFPRQIAVALDTRGEMVAVKGWTEDSGMTAASAAAALKDSGVSMVIKTDIDRDGTLSGLDLGRLESFLTACNIPVVASGGVSRPEDIEKLLPFQKSGLRGVIVGRAAYSGGVDIKSAIRRFS
ncbi:MAG: 1-(5-phosphoribosyl)-5-[(5-phosphoribosylamino)methylideneamino]imidazole-4-carboxamide isomerase [Candidatus Mycalebacterium zealandia]|nr:MAG: 1-(5-phosphoribosyl)-5-[(5-phosphoribosylamino)methylideneamino]imidazole-4-carboxamide isomerase [Candidatus Mycalebacterium zealandia]